MTLPALFRQASAQKGAGNVIWVLSDQYVKEQYQGLIILP